MSSNDLMSGVLAPVVTPFDASYEPDKTRLLEHCRWLLSNNCGLAVFGTNSEANSLTVDERLHILDTLVEAGIDPKRMMPGTGTCAFGETARLSKHAIELGAAGVLMLPPFYYKDVSDEGLYRSYSEVIERVGDDRLRIYLYHFPKMSAVPLGVDLVARLREAFPEIVVGMKDSSGDPDNFKAMLDAFPGFAMFVGSEGLLLANMQAGGAGCISGTANANPAAIDELYQSWQGDGAADLQASVSAVRDVFQGFPLLPGVKRAMAHFRSDPDWARVRPPLVELDDAAGSELVTKLKDTGFEMTGL